MVAKTVTLASALLLILTVVPAVPFGRADVTPSLVKYEIPPICGTGVAVGIAYSATLNAVYYADYAAGYVLRIGASNGMLDNVTSPTRQCYDKTYYGLALDGNGNLWLTRRNPGNDGTPPGLSFVNTQTGLTTDVQDT